MDNNYNSNCSIQLEFYQNDKQMFDKCVNLMIENHFSYYSDKPITILDIGCSHGRNSIFQVNNILELVNLKIEKPIIQVYHDDLEINDFTKLFLEIKENPSSYIKKSKGNKNNIFTYAIGKGFENQLLPDSTVDFIFSYFTFQWLHCDKPSLYYNPNSLIVYRESSRPDGYSLYFKNKLESSFDHRLKELKPGGIFVCNFIILGNEGIHQDVERSYANLKQVLLQMVEEKVIKYEEISNLSLPISFLTKNECDQVVNNLLSKGLNLLCTDTKLKDVHEMNNLDISIKINAMLSIVGPIIKNAFVGTPDIKESNYNNLVSRVHSIALIDNYKFDFSFTIAYYYFQKQIS